MSKHLLWRTLMLMVFAVFGTAFAHEAHAAGTLVGFTYSASPINANGQEVQTFQLTLAGATGVDDVRFIVNHPWHTQNGRQYDGYFQITPSLCRENGGGLGNNRVTLDTSSCTTITEGNNTIYTLSFTLDSNFGGATNHQVSAIWYAAGVVQSGSWKRVTTLGQGFESIADPNFQPPAAIGSFSYDLDRVNNNGTEEQSFRLNLTNGSRVTDVRFIINHPWHTENGRQYDGYLQITPELCKEFLPTYGNEDLEINAADCTVTTNQDGSVDFVVPFTVLSSYGTADNNTVSVLWFEPNAGSGTWKKLTTTGNGFDVGPPPAPIPASFASFSYDQQQVTNDNVEVQTFRVTLNNATNVTEVYTIVNRYNDNGNVPGGYFKRTPTVCSEFGTSFGNDKVSLITDQCEIITNGTTKTYVFNYTVNSTYPVSTKNAVYVFWREGTTTASLRRVTPLGQGFDVVAPAP